MTTNPTNILEVRQQILQNIDFGSILENVSPTTIAGDQYLKSLINFVNEGKATTITSISKIATQCLNQFKNDISIYQIGEALVEKLNENINPMIVYCYESVQHQSEQGNTLAKQLSEKLESISILESNKEKTSIIRSGALFPYKTVNESVTLLQNSVAIKTKENVQTAIHEAYNPIIYVEKINETNYVKLGNNVFSVNENSIVKTVSPTSKFSFMSSIVEELVWDDTNEAFVYNESGYGKFLITESQIERIVDENSTVFENDNDFVKHMSLITESYTNKKAQMSANRLFDSLLSVKNNFSNFVLADNITVVENKQTHEKYALVVLENMSFVCTLQSVRYPNIVESFARIDEALESLRKKSGYSAEGFVTEALKNLSESDNHKKVIVENYTQLIESLQEKEIEILNAIEAAKFSNQPNKLAKLNESLLLVRAHIVEQKTNFGLAYNKKEGI